MPVDVKATAGSAANLRLLQQGFLQLAIVQSDTLQDAANGQGDFAETGGGCRFGTTTAVAELAKELDIRLISLDERAIAQLLSLYDCYSSSPRLVFRLI